MIPPIVRRGLLLAPLMWLAGCDTVVLNPSGDIAAQQAHLVVVSTLLMLLIIVPVMFLICWFAWRYRKSNTAAEYKPDWDHSTKLELLIWGAPLLIIIVLGLITWIYTHLLDPYRPLSRIDENRPIAAGVKPLEVQVVSMDWKWMFIYPEQGIATVNELVTPIDVPVRFHMTSTSVMNAFYIPALAGMVYTMPSMETQLNAVMNKVGVYDGFSANYSGAGFSDMKFKYHGVSQADFDAWVAKTKTSTSALTRAEFLALDKPTIKHPIMHFGSVDKGMYDLILNRCVAEGSTCINTQMHQDATRIKAAAAIKKLPEEVCEPTNVAATTAQPTRKE
ncbi:cytochrome bo3 quinol oxidase subunit 2 [Duganella sp. CF402]|uniref:ubiquinol oxidase subunit II n=1 Tax=unclassified Duganella TaxID=2636909 RepID=UPI0008D247B9|nr:MULTISPECIES: ubiquinol oxidase subunit II [unclassified Duganella]RZT10351.1 cytochrome bo3 quinol oxidase subunit 2 [Duganella sp. BK701]SEL17030.1 cytochrome bo3 quinol oxidase subunit 2 [Duganella sp. CF402]